jgi:hypothetical protein
MTIARHVSPMLLVSRLTAPIIIPSVCSLIITAECCYWLSSEISQHFKFSTISCHLLSRKARGISRCTSKFNGLRLVSLMSWSSATSRSRLIERHLLHKIHAGPYPHLKNLLPFRRNHSPIHAHPPPVLPPLFAMSRIAC